MNPVQFKVSSVEDVKTKVKGMTAFNTEQVNTKKQPMFFGKPLGSPEIRFIQIPSI